MINIVHIIKIFQHVNDKYRRKITALNGVSMNILEGEIIAIIGNSGSGKTTLLEILSGKLEPSAGMIMYKAYSIFEINESERQKLMSENVFYIRQEMSKNLIYESTVYENFLIYLLSIDKFNDTIIKEVMKEFDIEWMADMRVSLLSGGEKQIICMAMATLSNSNLVIIDEPTQSVDVMNKHILMKRICDYCKSKGITLIFTTHDHEIAKYSNKVFGIYYGNFDRIINNSDSENYQSLIKETMEGIYYQVPIDNSGKVFIPESIRQKIHHKGYLWIREEGDKIYLTTKEPEN